MGGLKVSSVRGSRLAHGAVRFASDLRTDLSGPGTCFGSPPREPGNYIVPRGVRSSASGTGEKRLLVAPSKRPRAFSPAPTFGPTVLLEIGCRSNDSFSTHHRPTSFGAASLLVPASAGRTTACDRDAQVARDDLRSGPRGRPFLVRPPDREGTPRGAAARPHGPCLRRAHRNNSLGVADGIPEPTSLRAHDVGLETQLAGSGITRPRGSPFGLSARPHRPGVPRRGLPTHGGRARAQPLPHGRAERPRAP